MQFAVCTNLHIPDDRTCMITKRIKVVIPVHEVGRACSTYGGRGKVHTGFWWGDVREGDHLEDPGLDGRMILKWMFRKWDGGGGHGLDLYGSG
jgi:hypothetical protein